MQIQAAKGWGLLPTSLILKDRGRRRPSKWDLILAEAEALVEMERCKQCGQPRYVCLNADPDIAFDILVEECFATQARDKAEKSRNKGKKEAPQGVALGTVPYSFSGTPLDEFRQPFYDAEQKKREEKVALRPSIPRDKPL